MDNNGQNLSTDVSNQITSPDEPVISQSGSKKIISIAVITGVIIIIVFIIIMLSSKTANKKITTTPSAIPTQAAEIKTGNTATDLEDEASSIKVDDVESNLSEIDKDLKEFN